MGWRLRQGSHAHDMQKGLGRKKRDPGLYCVLISYPATLHAFFFPWLLLAM